MSGVFRGFLRYDNKYGGINPQKAKKSLQACFKQDWRP